MIEKSYGRFLEGNSDEQFALLTGEVSENKRTAQLGTLQAETGAIWWRYASRRQKLVENADVPDGI